MQSAAVILQSSPGRRFHPPFWKGRFALGIASMGLATVHAFAGHSQYHLIEGMFWACFGIFYFASGMAVWWELRAEGLLRRNFWDTELIPYTDITSIEQLTDMARPVEVQYFSTSPDTFPRKKMIIVISDRQNFIDALIKLAPSAEFRS